MGWGARGEEERRETKGVSVNAAGCEPDKRVRGGGDNDPNKTGGSGCKEYACTENSDNGDQHGDSEGDYNAHGNGDYGDGRCELHADGDGDGDRDADDDQHNNGDGDSEGNEGKEGGRGCWEWRRSWRWGWRWWL